MGFDITSFLMGQKAGGGGGGSNIFEWDFTSATPLVDKVRGDVATNSNVTFVSSGAKFDSTSDYLVLSSLAAGVTIEIDWAEMTPSPGARVVCSALSNGQGLVYRSTGKWAFSNGSVVDSSITAADYFSGHTMKIHIDAEGKWHIYRDDELAFEPNLVLFLANKVTGTSNISFYIGSSSNSLSNAIISGVRVY